MPRNPIRRTAFGDVWRAAVKAAGAPTGTGFHELRHYYASLLIRHGESVKPYKPAGSAQRRRDAGYLLPLWPEVTIAPVRRSILSLLRTPCGLRRWPTGHNP